MLEWVKVDSRFMFDKRIRKLMDDYGYSGVGVYLTMRIAISAMDESGLPMDVLMAVCSPDCRRNKMKRIINDYGLFKVSETGLVTFEQLTHDYTPARTPGLTPKDTPTRVPEYTPANRSAYPPSQDIYKKEDKRKRLSLEREYSENEKALKQQQQNQATGNNIPTLDEVRLYCMERNRHIDAEKFWDYYAAIGWMVNGNPVTDWRALMRVWEKRETDAW